MIVIKKNTVDVSSSIKSNSLQFKSVLTKEISTLEFSVLVSSGKTTFIVGDEVDMYEGSTHIFGGTVTNIKNFNDGGKLIETAVSCVDWSFRLNSKLVTKTYSAMDPSAIVADILTNFTDGTYTTTNVVVAGYNVATVKFNYQPVTTAIEKLAKQIGWEWYVDADKDLHFFPPDTTSPAPFGIDDTSGNLNWPTLDINQDLTNMKNSVYVVGGTYAKTFDATTTPDKYVTDGIRSVFPLSYPYDATTIVVTLAGSSQSVGTDQITPDASVQVQYSDLGRFIRFTSVPTTGQTVKIYGNAKIPILVHIQNNTSVLNYGEIQDVIIDPNIKSVDEARERAQAQLDLYGTPVYTAKFDTLKTGLVIGQLLNINSVILGININVIIKEIDGKLYSPTQMIYSVTAVGTERVSFIDIMKVLLLQANASSQISDSTILQALESVSESVALTEVLSAPTTNSPPYVWGGAGGNVGLWNKSTWG